MDGKKVVIGSHHFVFEDEGCVIPEGEEEKFDALPEEYSHLFLGVGGVYLDETPCFGVHRGLPHHFGLVLAESL